MLQRSRVGGEGAPPGVAFDGPVPDGDVSDGRVPDGEVSGGGVPDGGVTDGGVTDGGVLDGPSLAARLPDAALVAELLGCDLGTLDDFALVEAVAAWRRIESCAAAHVAQAAAILSERASMNPFWPEVAGSVKESCVAGEELALRLGCSRRAARELIGCGRAYDGALWLTGEALERGEIDERKARILVTALAPVPGQVAVAVQEEVLDRAGRRTHSELAADVQRALIRVDPDEAAERAARATRDRRVCRPRVLPDGLAGIWAVLPAPAAVALDSELDAVARRVRGLGDTRTLDQLRADTLCAAVIGHRSPASVGARGATDAPEAEGPACADAEGHACGDAVCPASVDTEGQGCADAVCPASVDAEGQGCADAEGEGCADARLGRAGVDGPPSGADGPSGHARSRNDAPGLGQGVPGQTDLLDDILAGPPLGAHVQVTVPLDVLLGAGDGSAELAGYGAIDPATAEAIARGGTWTRLVTDPLTETVLDVGRTRYRPPPGLDRHVRTRDGTCVRPGCPTSAWSCDLDHTVPFGDPADVCDGGTDVEESRPRTGGSTSADNLGALCRREHLLKTHGGFGLRQVAPGVFEWTTPTGHRYVEPPTGPRRPVAATTGAGGDPTRGHAGDAGDLPGAGALSDAAAATAARLGLTLRPADATKPRATPEQAPPF
jgi:hypothetical protein